MDINSVKHSDLLDKAELRHPAGAKALLNWSGWPVSWSLGTNPKVLRRPLLFARLLPVWQESTFNLREH